MYYDTDHQRVFTGMKALNCEGYLVHLYEYVVWAADEWRADANAEFSVLTELNQI